MADESDNRVPEPPPPPATEPVLGIDMATYASVSAALSTGAVRDSVLSERQITDTDWFQVERIWALRLVAHAQRGEHEVLLAFERAYAAALQALTPAEPSKPLPVYAQVVASLQAGVPMAVICTQVGLSFAELGQLQRSWTQRLAQDPGLNSTFDALLASDRG